MDNFFILKLLDLSNLVEYLKNENIIDKREFLYWIKILKKYDSSIEKRVWEMIEEDTGDKEITNMLFDVLEEIKEEKLN